MRPTAGVVGMLYYRLYFFDRHSHIDHFREFEAQDDARAIDIAERWIAGQVTELWNRERRLKRWEIAISDGD